MEQEKFSFMKRSIIWIIILIAIDQGIKMFIAHFMMEAQFTIIPHVFSFQTTQNIHLGWIWNMLDFMMPLYIAVVLSVVAMLIVVIVYRYLKFLTGDWEKYSKLLDIFLIFMLAVDFAN